MRAFAMGLVCFVLMLLLLFAFRDSRENIFNRERPTAVFSGVASFYGKEDGFHGKCMANGHMFNKEEMTAAHRSLPLGTKVRVTRLEHSVVVYITDRGPYIRGRIIDLSEAAARELKMIHRGVAHVTIEVLSTPHRSKKYHHENPQCLKGDKKTEETVKAGIRKNPAFLCPREVRLDDRPNLSSIFYGCNSNSVQFHTLLMNPHRVFVAELSIT